MGEPATLDPAAAGDAGSAAVIAQLFEGLTAIDPTRTPRPALAERWELRDGGRTVVFTLRRRPPVLRRVAAHRRRRAAQLAAGHRPAGAVARSRRCSTTWKGPATYAAGQRRAPTRSGSRAAGSTLEVRLTRPAGDFPAIAASPHAGGRAARGRARPDGPASRARRSSGRAATCSRGAPRPRYTLRPTPATGPGRPRSTRSRSSPTSAGAARSTSSPRASWTGRRSREYDASWIAYDPDLGPEPPPLVRPRRHLLRVRDAAATVRRRARPARLRVGAWTGRGSSSSRTATAALPATSMVPPGIPGRSDESFLPAYDPAAARRLLAEAGYRGPGDLPRRHPRDRRQPATTRRSSPSSGRTSGSPCASRPSTSGPSSTASAARTRPTCGPSSWIADYPSPNDFLGILLGHRPAEQLRRLVECRVRRRDRVGGRDRRPGDGACRLRRGRVDPRATRCRRSP